MCLILFGNGSSLLVLVWSLWLGRNGARFLIGHTFNSQADFQPSPTMKFVELLMGGSEPYGKVLSDRKPPYRLVRKPPE